MVGLVLWGLVWPGCTRQAPVVKQEEAAKASLAAQIGKGWALVIGIQDYDKAGAPRFAVADARMVAETLGGQGFEVATLYDRAATRAAIEAAISQTLARQVAESDQVVIFFAGAVETRMVSGGRKAFLLPAEADPAAVETALDLERVRELAEALPAKQVLLVVDASLGGIEGQIVTGLPAMTPAALAAAIKERGRQVLVAGGPGQPPWDMVEGGHSLFGHYLLEGLDKGLADVNQDGMIAASELATYLERHVGTTAQVLGRPQRPQLWAQSAGKGEVVFRPVSRASVPPAPPPPTQTDKAVRESEEELKVLERTLRELEAEEARSATADEKNTALPRRIEELRRQVEERRGRFFDAQLQARFEVIGEDGARMVLIPAGEFTMGEDSRKYAVGDPNYNFAPKHQVYLDAYYIDKYEVTTARYAKFLQKDKRTPPRFWSEVSPESDANRPVVGVSWEDAAAYCRWAGKRLPTEAEWEKAARGTDGRKYPWGNEEPRRSAASYDWYGLRSWQGYGTLSPVGSYEEGRSPYGVYDMAGNVWEWVADWYERKYYLNSPPRNPKGPETGKERVVRGGSWRHAPELMRSAYRHRYQPTVLPFTYLGFRCAQDVPKEPLPTQP